MRLNMGTADRVIRVILAIVFGILYFTGTVTGIWGIVLLIVGLVFILTSLTGTCPGYLPFGWSTRGE